MSMRVHICIIVSSIRINTANKSANISHMTLQDSLTHKVHKAWKTSRFSLEIYKCIYIYINR